MTARTPEMQAKYDMAIKKGDLQPINELDPIKSWTYWIFVRNTFYHDKECDAGYMIVLTRECNDIWEETTNYEIFELWRVIMPQLKKLYHRMDINLEPCTSIKNIVHVHIKLLKAENLL